jgi:hypothetical protein
MVRSQDQYQLLARMFVQEEKRKHREEISLQILGKKEQVLGKLSFELFCVVDI